jgi:cellulose synthase/poly-beta-1,6-N-acetylglucosamine synthase-like glycosyltransferase
MRTVSIIIIVIYGISLLFIFSYSLVQLHLVITYLRNKYLRKDLSSRRNEPIIFFPCLTVQLPIYNELYVVERLLDSISKLDYPPDKLQIQVLDDSTDETSDAIKKKIAFLESSGRNIMYVHRSNRTGFKAGALAHGFQIGNRRIHRHIRFRFYAAADFLRKIIPRFNDEKTGMIQARWEHVNENYSMLTQLQAFGLDAHFTVEQTGRNLGGHFINFNGTAGVWRKSCIADAGGWQHDTLTEDLDLSYRAQLKGWKFFYMENVGAPAELPVTMSALKNQQFRWNKGAAECVVKNLPAVLRKKEVSLVTKVHALFHLMNSTVFLFIMITAFFSIPLLFIKHSFEEFKDLFLYASFFLLSLLTLGMFYFTASSQKHKKFPKNLLEFLLIFPLFLAVSMGLALHNTVAVLQGYFGWKTPFKRTPKFNIENSGKSWKTNKYLERSINWITLAEGLFALYFLSGIVVAVALKDYGLLPFHLMLAFGFGFVFLCSLLQSKVPALRKK